MKKKLLNYIIMLMILIIPLNTKADILTTYGETVTKANNYITAYNDRRKYLIFNKNYVYEKSGFGDSSAFNTGGLLSKSEFDLSIVSNKSYLANGKEYWTLTSNGSNNYYIDAYVQSKTTSSTSATRVTQYIKPGTTMSGNGTYSNPWTFVGGFSVDIISNNTSFGTVSPSVAQYVVQGSTIRYLLVPKDGYYYNGTKDECGLIKEGANKYENKYLKENINKDITCTVVFEPQTYKFDLQINDEAKDYKNVKKSYTSNPNPNTIYYKYKNNWYSNSTSTSVINKITKPSVLGWTFNGYYYGSTKVIDSDGNILLKNLNLGSTNDFRNIEHTLYGNISKNNYTINYDLNGGTFGTSHPTNAKYDEVIEISNPTRAGYSFAGWSFNGNSSTARTGSTSSNVNTTFTKSTTKTLDQYFVNLTPTAAATVTLTANWSACPAGTYNDGSKTSCTACGAGSYTSTTGNTKCEKCVVGSYNTGTGNTSCTACQNGKTTTTTGQSSCNDNCSNSSNVNTWKEATWNSNNTLSNGCAIDSCDSTHKLSDNACVLSDITVTFNANGGTASSTSKKVDYNQKYGSLPTATNRGRGYVFDGWYTQASGGDKVTSETTVTAQSNHTLYAHWTQIGEPHYINNNTYIYVNKTASETGGCGSSGNTTDNCPAIVYNDSSFETTDTFYKISVNVCNKNTSGLVTLEKWYIWAPIEIFDAKRDTFNPETKTDSTGKTYYKISIYAKCADSSCGGSASNPNWLVRKADGTTYNKQSTTCTN